LLKVRFFTIARVPLHPVLTGLDATACYREILESKLACEALIDGPVFSFANPYGDFDAKTREAVKIAGFIFACSIERGPVANTYDLFALPRIHIANWDGDVFERALQSA
jgi:hypothetical protein